MLCRNDATSSRLGLPPAGELAYLGKTGCLESPGWDDDEEFQDTSNALRRMGLDAQEAEQLWRVLAAVLLLGELSQLDVTSMPCT